MKVKRALISVSDKTGVVELGKALADMAKVCRDPRLLGQLDSLYPDKAAMKAAVDDFLSAGNTGEA